MSELLQNTTPSLEVEEAAYLASMKELLKQIKIRFDNDPRQYTKRDYYYLIQYLCQNLNYLDEADLANVLNDLDRRIDDNVTRINELSAVDTTYSSATETETGLMSAEDKVKLNSLSNYELPADIQVSSISLTTSEGATVSLTGDVLAQLLALIAVE